MLGDIRNIERGRDPPCACNRGAMFTRRRPSLKKWTVRNIVIDFLPGVSVHVVIYLGMFSDRFRQLFTPSFGADFDKHARGAQHGPLSIIMFLFR